MGGEVLLKCTGICKSFGPTKALVDVDFEVRRGEVCGLVGENGSGKSTLTSIIAGVQRADSGSMLLHGKEYLPKSMLDGQKQKIGMIVQETGTLSNVSVADNIFAGDMGSFKRRGLVDKKLLYREAAKILGEIGATDISPRINTGMLNYEERKIVEIARAMYYQPDILIIDESTTALAAKGRAILYKIIQEMQKAGKAVVFISHDLDEVMEVCNCSMALRDGHRIDVLQKEKMSIPVMRKLMVGREMSDHYYRTDYDGSYGDEILLDLRQLTSADGRIMNVDLQLHKGEILGIGGLADSGMHELGRMACGIDETLTGEIVCPQKGCRIKSFADAVKAKIGYVSKNRDAETIVVTSSIRENIVLPSLKSISKGILVSGAKEKAIAAEQKEKLAIKCVNEEQVCSELSGGNKQKVALGKWLAYDCDIFVIDCPTRGIDIGVKAAVYEIMKHLKDQGKGILMITEELTELIGMSDRMLIMKDGAITGEFSRDKDLREAHVIEHMV